MRLAHGAFSNMPLQGQTLTPFVKKDFIFLFLERGEGREKKEGEKQQSVASHMPPDQGPNPQPSHVPDGNQTRNNAPPTEPPAREDYNFSQTLLQSFLCQ